MSNATHRLLWTVVALVLLGVGIAGTALTRGDLPGTDPASPLLWSGLLRWWRGAGPWPVLAVALVGLLLALLGYRLLRRELRGPGEPAAGELLLGGSSADPAGQVRIRAGVLQRGLARDLRRDPRIRAVRVVLAGATTRPQCWIQLRIAPGVSTVEVREHVAAALHRFTSTVGPAATQADVTARLDAPPRPR